MTKLDFEKKKTMLIFLAATVFRWKVFTLARGSEKSERNLSGASYYLGGFRIFLSSGIAILGSC